MAASATNLILDIDRDTMEYVSGWDRCRKSLYTIATTRLRTRIMRLWWGCDYLNVMDKPMTQIVFGRSIKALMQAFNDYEPEVDVTSVSLNPAGNGSCLITVTLTYLPDKTAKTATFSV